MYQLLWLFFVYSFLGWCTEVCYAALTSGRFVNRGFLNGPVCPIYGFGVLLVLACLEPLRDNLFLLFLGSLLLTSLLEWLTGFLLERLFHQRWWDYSDEPFNIGGYICLRFSVGWGLACLFVIKLVHPSVLWLIGLVPRSLGWVLLALLGAVLAADLAATVRAIAKINRGLSQIDELAGRIREVSDDLGEDLADRVLEAAERGADLKNVLEERRLARQQQREQRTADVQAQLEELRARLQAVLDENSFGRRRLLSAFPHMRSLDHRQALERLRRRTEQRLRERKSRSRH